MTTTLIRPPAFAFDAPTRLPGGLLSAASVSEGLKWLDPDGLVEGYNCLTIGATAFPCPPEDTAKDLSQGPTWTDGFRFSVYGGITCKAPGYTAAEAEAKVKASFTAIESSAVEKAFMLNAFGGTPTDITPTGGAVAPLVGLALLEQDAACKYAGVPTIHMARSIGTLLSVTGILVQRGDSLFTLQGSKVASGGGYGCPNLDPAGDDAADGESWMYATGEVGIARGELFAASGFDQSNNEQTVLVERTYIGAVDCYAAAVDVKVER
jgi:hypothetical protein